jgi:hypothetical protein
LLYADNFGIAWLITVELLVALGALVVRVFAIRPKVRGSNPAEGDGFLRAIKSAASLPSEGKYRCQSNIERFYGMVKISSKYDQRQFVRQN